MEVCGEEASDGWATVLEDAEDDGLSELSESSELKLTLDVHGRVAGPTNLCFSTRCAEAPTESLSL